MALFEVTVTSIGHMGHSPILRERVELAIERPPRYSSTRAIAIEVLKLVDGAECPFDCDTCREDQ